MRFYEYESKQLLATHGVPTSKEVTGYNILEVMRRVA